MPRRYCQTFSVGSVPATWAATEAGCCWPAPSSWWCMPPGLIVQNHGVYRREWPDFRNLQVHRHDVAPGQHQPGAARPGADDGTGPMSRDHPFNKSDLRDILAASRRSSGVGDGAASRAACACGRGLVPVSSGRPWASGRASSARRAPGMSRSSICSIRAPGNSAWSARAPAKSGTITGDGRGRVGITQRRTQQISGIATRRPNIR